MKPPLDYELKKFVKQHQSCRIRCQSTRFFTDFNLTAGRNFVTGSKPRARSFSTVSLQIFEDNPKNFLGEITRRAARPHPTFNIQAHEEHEEHEEKQTNV